MDQINCQEKEIDCHEKISPLQEVREDQKESLKENFHRNLQKEETREQSNNLEIAIKDDSSQLISNKKIDHNNANDGEDQIKEKEKNQENKLENIPTPNDSAKEESHQSEIDKINEINKKCIDLIQNDKSEAALNKLKQAEVKLERIVLELYQNIDKKLLMVILHNIACCYQKMKDYENCISYLEAVIYHFETMLESKYNINLNLKQLSLEPSFNMANGSITNNKAKCSFVNLDNTENNFNSNNNSHLNSEDKDKEKLSYYGDIILQLRYFAKFHLQMCAVLSQANQHKEALNHCELAALLCEDNLNKTKILFEKTIVKQQETIDSKKRNSITISDDANNKELTEQIKELQNLIDLEIVCKSICFKIRHFRETLSSQSTLTLGVDKINSDSYSSGFPASHSATIADLENILSENNPDEYKKAFKSLIAEHPEEDWIKFLNIGNIMYLSPISVDELDLESDPGCELLRDAVIEKIVMLSVSYFCLATEYKFISEDKEKISENMIISELYHSKAVEFSFSYIPLSCPIIKHYITTYNKHYNTNLEPIVSTI